MMRCNLAILLAERNLKVTKVFNDTGISRTTLTSLFYNHAKGIQFDTYNTLCNYLKITTDQLISYIPIDIDIISMCDQNLLIQIQQNNIKYDVSLFIQVDVEKEYWPEEEQEWVKNIEIIVGLYEPDDDDEDLKNQTLFIDSLHKLPTPFLTDLENQIIEKVINDYDVTDGAGIQFTWDDELGI